MTETPFRVTLDLRIGSAQVDSSGFHVQAEVFKQEWEMFRDLPQPWAVELAADRLFLLPD
jgi:molybdate transport system permease protein